MSDDLRHFSCPTCGRLCSVPWDAAWCLHSETVQPRPPEWLDSNWERMRPVTDVTMRALPEKSDEWYVMEFRNPYGYPNNEIPGKDKVFQKVIAGPLLREDAYALAKSQPRDKVPPHIHYFRTIPGDLIDLRKMALESSMGPATLPS